MNDTSWKFPPPPPGTGVEAVQVSNNGDSATVSKSVTRCPKHNFPQDIPPPPPSLTKGKVSDMCQICQFNTYNIGPLRLYYWTEMGSEIKDRHHLSRTRTKSGCKILFWFNFISDCFAEFGNLVFFFGFFTSLQVSYSVFLDFYEFWSIFGSFKINRR